MNVSLCLIKKVGDEFSPVNLGWFSILYNLNGTLVTKIISVSHVSIHITCTACQSPIPFHVFNWFGYCVFFCLNRLWSQDQRFHPSLLFQDNRICWIHSFPKDISAMWNSNGFLPDLKPSCRIHSLRSRPLQHKPLLYKICKKLSKAVLF